MVFGETPDGIDLTEAHEDNNEVQEVDSGNKDNTTYKARQNQSEIEQRMQDEKDAEALLQQL